MPLAYPDKQARSYGNQFAQNVLSSGLSNVDFGFGAGLIKMVVDSGGPAYVQLNGQPATTNDYKLTSGDLLTDWYNIGVPQSGVSFAATSTVLNMRVGAWG